MTPPQNIIILLLDITVALNLRTSRLTFGINFSVCIDSLCNTLISIICAEIASRSHRLSSFENIVASAKQMRVQMRPDHFLQLFTALDA